jgi:bifunctional DNA-binding transcriptional regulator/antitoxin component of YhaV-PrlF toxin-antitoxin module
MSSKFITEIKQDASTEDYYIEIPDHILNTLKWKKGDTICWSIKDGKIILTRLNDTTQSTEEPTMSDYDWYTVKKEEIDEYLNSESEGKEYKDYDEKYDQYIEDTAKETFGEYYHSPEAQGSWS